MPPAGTVVFASCNNFVFDAVAPCFNTFDTIETAPVLVPIGGAVVCGAVGASVVDVEVGELDDDDDDDEDDDVATDARVTANVYVVVEVPVDEIT